MKSIRRTFRGKLLMLFALFSLAPLLVVGLGVSQLVRDIYRTSVQESLSQAISVREELGRRYFEAMRTLVRNILAQELLVSEVNEAVTGLPYDKDLVYATLVAFRRDNAFIEKVEILNTDGTVIVSTASDEEGRVFKDTETFKATLSGKRVQVGSVVVSSYGKRVIPISGPVIRKSDGAIIGVLTIEFNVAALSSEFIPRSGIGSPTRAEVYVIDEDGYPMTRTTSIDPNKQIWTLPVRNCQQRGEHTTGTWTGFDGVTEMFGMARCVGIDNLRFTLIAEEPSASAFAVSRQAALMVMLTAFGVIAALAVVIIQVSRSVTNPISVLRGAARELGKGNFDFSIPIYSQDELADLAADFDRARHKLRSAREQEARLAQMKSEFISIAAHQLRTPLTGIKWSLEELLLDAKSLPEAKIADLKRTTRSINEMIMLVNDLLNVSHIEDGRMEYRFEEGDIYLFAKDIAENVSQRHKDKAVQVVVEPLPGPLPHIRFDREKLSIVVTNIVDNAIKYTPNGGTVTMRCFHSPGSVVIEVSDTGIGIPEAERRNLFSKFFRAKNAIRTQASGSGLGLFVAQQIAQAHGGGISVDSTEGKGTRMRIQLPTSAGKRA